VRTQMKAEHLVGFLAARAENEHRRLHAILAQRSQHAVAVHARQHQVENDQVGHRRTRERETARAVARHVDLVAFDLEVVAKPGGQVPVVLDDENSRHARNSMTNRAPPAGASSTHASPPWSRASSRTTYNP